MPTLREPIETVIGVRAVDHFVEAKPDLRDHHPGKDHRQNRAKARLVRVLSLVVHSNWGTKIVDICEGLLALLEAINDLLVYIHF